MPQQKAQPPPPPKEVNKPLSLTVLPNVVLNAIMEYCEFDDIFGLRLVCKKMKEKVDEIKPDVRLETIAITVYANQGFMCQLGYNDFEPTVTLYKIHPKGCMIKNWLYEGQDAIQVLSKHLETLLNHQKSTIEMLTLRASANSDDLYWKFMINFGLVLKKRPQKLKVDKLEAMVLDQDQALQIIPYLDPKVLKNLVIGHTNINQWLVIDKIFQTEQWKNVDDVAVPETVIKDPKQYAHIAYPEIRTQVLDAKTVEEFRNMIINSPILKKIKIFYKTIADNDQGILKFYGQLKIFDRPDGHPGVIRYHHDLKCVTMEVLDNADAPPAPMPAMEDIIASFNLRLGA